MIPPVTAPGDHVERGIVARRVVGVADAVGDVLGQALVGGASSGGVDQRRAVVDPTRAVAGPVMRLRARAPMPVPQPRATIR